MTTEQNKSALAADAFALNVDSSTKAEVLTAMQAASGLAKSACDAMYRTLCLETGKRAMTPAAKHAHEVATFLAALLPAEGLKEADTAALFNAREEAVKQTAEKFSDMSENMVARAVRDHFKACGIAMPRGYRQVENYPDKAELVTQMVADGATGKEIRAALVEKFGYTANSARTTMYLILEREGLEAPNEAASARELALEHYIANPEAESDDLLKHYTDQIGLEESTARNYLHQFEYARGLVKRFIEAGIAHV